jgi:hypothetical protein
LFLLVSIAHLCHSGVIWEGESLPLAAAMQMARGSVLYRDIWFDKPLLVPAVYLLWGAHAGPLLRIAGTVYAMIACVLAYVFAAGLWTRREGYWAAALLAFFLTFDIHSGVLPLTADLLLLAPHLAAVMLAVRKQAFWSGVAAGIGFLFNTKGLFVLAACVLFAWPYAIPLLAGFAVPSLAALAWLAGHGALSPSIDQVWRWPALYATSPVVADPIWNGVIRSLNWLGFHAILAIGAIVFWWRTASKATWQFLAWTVLCYAGVVLGWRFFPRYFFLLLPVLVISAARGMTLLRSGAAIAIALLALAVPFARFGPRYALLGNDLVHGRRSTWSDLAIDRDSRDAAEIARRVAHRDAYLYVWGYRPEMYVYTRMRPATKFLDSQALTGVPADRHLTQSAVVLTAGTAEAREELARSKPDVLIDGLSPYNPALSMDRYAVLRPWLGAYIEAGRTAGSVVYVRRSTVQAVTHPLLLPTIEP